MAYFMSIFQILFINAKFFYVTHYQEILEKSLRRIRLETGSFVSLWKTVARRAFNLMTSLARARLERHDHIVHSMWHRKRGHLCKYLHSTSYASMHHSRSRLRDILLSSSHNQILSTSSLSCQRDNISLREHKCLYPSSLYNERKRLQLKINFNPH